ncbi:DNA alkylation repair protein [bacterium]|nr:DNA alkylation repair protein [bacterium]MBU1959371.1 DNA alkylation repair protein [bacterium]
MKATNPPKFSLKDELYNSKKVAQIAHEIKEVYASFDANGFGQDVLEKFPNLELKERIYHIRDMFSNYLPADYIEATKILLKALPTELDEGKGDDDFGDFIYAPYSDFVVTHGCTKEHLAFSLEALREMTKRFSVEFSIREFINLFPKETLAMLKVCALSNNYHERRLASEGLRPKLPWAKKLNIDYRLALEHLELLYDDKTRYVTRSVANHLNDIAKMDASLVIETLKRWKSKNKQAPKEMEFMINHALRTLVKQGNVEALEMLGYLKEPPIEVKNIRLKTSAVAIGEALEFEVELLANDEAMLLVDYVLHFCTKRGTLSLKVHKLKKLTLKKGEKALLTKRHPFKANMSTRKLYAGEHLLEVQINGTVVHGERFFLKV